MIETNHPEGLLADEPRAEIPPKTPSPALVLARFFTPQLEDPELQKIADTFAGFAAIMFQDFNVPHDRALAELLQDMLTARDNYIKARIIKRG
jgi:hypothetical protein